MRGFPGSGSAAQRLGRLLGTALGGTLTFESGYIEMLRNGRERVPPLSVVLGMSNAAAPTYRFSSAWGFLRDLFGRVRSSAVAIGEALPKIRSAKRR